MRPQQTLSEHPLGTDQAKEELESARESGAGWVQGTGSRVCLPGSSEHLEAAVLGGLRPRAMR